MTNKTYPFGWVFFYGQEPLWTGNRYGPGIKDGYRRGKVMVKTMSFIKKHHV